MTRGERKRQPSDGYLLHPRTPSGTAYPSLSSDQSERRSSTPVVLTWGTIFRLIGPAVAVTLAGASVALYFHWQAVSHMSDSERHLAVGERVRLETRDRADSEREGLLRSIRIEQQEMKLDTRVRLDQLEEEIKSTQARIVREIRRQGNE